MQAFGKPAVPFSSTKKGNPTALPNYRPIVLENTIYKLFPQ
jgi:hypothetical protein